MRNQYIKITGAKEHNLKNIDLTIPKYQLVALTGVSGSGKSSFAMDILQKECQRQYLESMGMVTDGLNKPQVDTIEGLSPSIAVGQRVLSKNPRSTVGTYTEILTYLRILYAKMATRICPQCGESIAPKFEETVELDENQEVCTKCKKKLERLTMASFSFNKPEGVCKKCKGIGTITTADYTRLVDENLSIREGAFFMWGVELYAEHYAQTFLKCAEHYGFAFDVDKKVGEFNAFEKLLFYKGVDDEAFKALYPNIKKPKRVADGYIEGVETYVEKKIAEAATKKVNNPKLNAALTESDCDTCEGLGVIPLDMQFLDDLEVECPVCKGHRFKKKILSVTYNEKSISDILNATVDENLQFFEGHKAITKKLMMIAEVGLGYLKLGQSTTTLSGGECQRIKLSKELAKESNGHTLYLLDEPTTGLHPSDIEQLLTLIRKIVSKNNSVFVIEHAMDIVAKSDYVIELGPDGGEKGGQIIAVGTPYEISQNKESLTGQYL